ncbi:MAG: HU family DNA-binding protein [Acidobacteriota bacterium]
MNKAELVEAICKDTNLTKADAGRALDAAIDNIVKSLKRKNPVTLVGFGTFKVAKRNARAGRNPQTGAPIKIAARTVAKFTAGSELKKALK